MTQEQILWLNHSRPGFIVSKSIPKTAIICFTAGKYFIIIIISHSFILYFFVVVENFDNSSNLEDSR